MPSYQIDVKVRDQDNPTTKVEVRDARGIVLAEASTTTHTEFALVEAFRAAREFGNIELKRFIAEVLEDTPGAKVTVRGRTATKNQGIKQSKQPDEGVLVFQRWNGGPLRGAAKGKWIEHKAEAPVVFKGIPELLVKLGDLGACGEPHEDQPRVEIRLGPRDTVIGWVGLPGLSEREE